MLTKVAGPDRSGREAMYYPGRQDFAYRRGAYDYLESVAMAPRLATLAAYLASYGVRRVLDVGCGTAHLLSFLPEEIGYLGVDIAPSAVERARERFAGRPDTDFFAADFRRWTSPRPADAVVWAGIGATWTLRGRGGDFNDWRSILDLAERHLAEDGLLLFELVTQHWPALEKQVEGRYDYLTGCDLDCFQSQESPKRSIRVFRRRPETSRAKTNGSSTQAVSAVFPATSPAPGEPPVTVSIPYYRGADYLRRAVDSILAQSHRNLTLVVVNDGDPESPWPLLEDIDDPRLVRFDLEQNRGRYFADAVVLEATRDPFLMIQDADDWSGPERLASLLDAVRASGAVGAVSDFAWHDAEGKSTGRRSKAKTMREPPGKLVHRNAHFGLFRTDALRRVGGYYGGLRLGYDTLITCLLPMFGTVAAVSKTLYHRRRHPDSLIHSPKTGKGSAPRRRAAAELRRLYGEALEVYRRHQGEDDEALAARLRGLVHSRLEDEESSALEEAAERLRPRLAEARTDGRPEAAESSPGATHFPWTVPAAKEMITTTHPMGQDSDSETGHLGFGYLYHGLVRLLRPEHVVSIGSYRGFSAVCLAMGLAENAHGECLFIDPGKVDGHWHDPASAEHLRRHYGLGDHFRHVLETSRSALEGGLVPERIDLLLIDGDHSYAGVKYDFENLGPRVPPSGLILLHDSTREGRGFTPWEVRQYLAAEIHDHARYEVLTLDLGGGLTVVRPKE